MLHHFISHCLFKINFFLVLFALFFLPKIGYAQETWSEIQSFSTSKTLIDDYRESLFQITRYNTINDKYTKNVADVVRHDILLTVQDVKEIQEEVIPHAEELVVNYLDHLDISFLSFELGKYFIALEDYDKAINYFEIVDLKQLRKRDRMVIHFKMGYAYLNKKKYEKAALSFQLIENKFSTYYKPSLYYYAFSMSKIDEFEEALTVLYTLENDDIFGIEVPLLIAKIYLKQKKYQRLIDYSLKLNRNYVEDVELSLLLAEAYFQLEKYDIASEYFKKITPDIDTDQNLAFKIGYSYYVANDYDDALIYFKQILEEGKQKSKYFIESQFYVGIIYYYQQKYETSLELIEKVIQFEDENMSILQRAMFVKLEILYNLKKFNTASSYFIKYIERFPRSKFIEKALKVFDYSLQNIIDTKKGLNWINKTSKILSENHANYIAHLKQKMLIKRGQQALADAEFELAYDSFIQAIKYPKRVATVLSHFGLAETLFAYKKYDEALTYYKYVAENITLFKGEIDNQIVLDTYYGIGYCYFNKREYNNAYTFFKMYLERIKIQKSSYPRKLVDAKSRLADCYYAVKEYETAEKLYLEIENQRYINKNYIAYQIANTKVLLEDYEQAEIYFKKVLDNTQEDELKQNAIFDLAKFYFQQTKYDEAIKYFNLFIYNCVDSFSKAKALLLRGIAYENKSDIANAELSFEEIINSHLETDQVEGAFNALRSLYIKQNKTEDYDRITNIYKTLNKDNEISKYIDYQSGLDYYNNKKYFKAIELFIIFITKHPNTPLLEEIKVMLSEAYLNVGDTQNAINIFKTRNDLKTYKNQIKLANLFQMQNDFVQSNFWFNETLSNENVTQDIVLKCYDGLMNNYYQMNKFVKMEIYLLKLYDLEKNNEKLLKYFMKLIKYYQNKEEFNLCKKYIELILSHNNANFIAEAYYISVTIHLAEKKYDACIDKVKKSDEFADEQEYWRGKAYIIMAECFIEKKNKPQAEGILESVIENISDEDVIAEAQTKLDNLNSIISK